MAPISALFAGYGVRLSHAMSKRGLDLAFGLFMFLVSLRFIISLGLTGRLIPARTDNRLASSGTPSPC